MGTSPLTNNDSSSQTRKKDEVLNASVALKGTGIILLEKLWALVLGLKAGRDLAELFYLVTANSVNIDLNQPPARVRIQWESQKAYNRQPRPIYHGMDI